MNPLIPRDATDVQRRAAQLHPTQGVGWYSFAPGSAGECAPCGVLLTSDAAIVAHFRTVHDIDLEPES